MPVLSLPLEAFGLLRRFPLGIKILYNANKCATQVIFEKKKKCLQQYVQYIELHMHYESNTVFLRQENLQTVFVSHVHRQRTVCLFDAFSRLPDIFRALHKPAKDLHYIKYRYTSAIAHTIFYK